MVETPGSIGKYMKELAFGLLIFLSILFSLHPYLRHWLREQILSEPRTILSTTNAYVIGNHHLQKIIKIKTKEGLALEIYEPSEDGRPNLIQKIQLPDHIDGYFYLNQSATNLAVLDVNRDQTLEIVAPTFDHNLTGHLNIFKYDQLSQRFVALAAEP